MHFRSPQTEQEWQRYFKFRWQQLREPLGLPLGSERDESEQHAHHLMAVTESEQIIATGRTQSQSNQQAQIRYMAVAPGYQKQGYGSQLLSQLEHYAHTQNIQRIWLNAREHAVGFYLKHGYEEIGPTAVDLPIPHFQLQKRID